MQLLFQSEKRLRASVNVERKIAAVCERMRNKHFLTLRSPDGRQHKAKVQETSHRFARALVAFRSREGCLL